MLKRLVAILAAALLAGAAAAVFLVGPGHEHSRPTTAVAPTPVESVIFTYGLTSR